MDEAVQERASFAVETTLSGRTYARAIPAWQAAGFHVTLIFLRLGSVEEAIRRVAERVRHGGHNIPAETIRRRFAAGAANFLNVYKPLVDAWTLLDNSGAAPILLDRSSR